MLKPYSTRNEFLLTLIAGSMYALAGGFSDHLAKPTRLVAHNGVLSGGRAGGRFGVRREQFVTRQTTAPHALRLYVNSEYCLNRYLDGISTLAELLRNPDRSSGI